MIFSASETIILCLLSISIAFECFLAIRSKSWIEIYRPTLFVAVLLVFYALVGPLRAVLSSGEVSNFVGTSGTFYRGIEHREFLVWGWLAALVFYISFLSGYHLFRPSVKPRKSFNSKLSSIRKSGTILCWLGLIPYLLVYGDRVIGMLNPFSPSNFNASFFGFSGLNLGAFENYFMLAINLLIPGVVIKYAVWLRTRSHSFSLAVWTLVASAIYLSEAFRYRILLLFVPILLLWLFYNKLRPKLVLLVLFMFLFIGLNGALSITRTNSFVRGVDITALSNYSPFEVFTSSFEEAGVFLTSSAIISHTPTSIPHSYLKPFSTSLLQPLPRQLFPNKPDGSYSSSAREAVYGTPNSYTAYLNFAEYYLAFGWLGVVSFSFIFGLLCKRLWLWFLWRQFEPLPQAIYLLNASFIYVIISRGYLPQAFMLYCFTVLPSFLSYRYLLTKKF